MDSTAVLARPEGSSSYRITVMPPRVVRTQLIGGGATDPHPWERRLDPRAGLEELVWFQQNRGELAAYQNRWIAILGRGIVAFGDSMREVRDQLRDRNLRDALVLHVPEDVARREYFIG
jgi:hypothetical protein